MSVIAAAVRELIAAGLTGDALVAAVERIEAAAPSLSEGEGQTARQARNRRYYEKRLNERLNKTVSDDSDAKRLNKTPPPSPPSPSVSLPPITPIPSTPSSTPSSDSSTVAGATRRMLGDEFEEFWVAYPKREGANPKKPAKALFLAKLKAGATAAEIVAGARACAVRDRDKIGTPYIPQAVKWLRDERWRDYAPGAAPTADGPQTFGWTPGKRTAAEIRASLKQERTGGEAGKADRVEQVAPVDEDGARPRDAEPELLRGVDRDTGGIRTLGSVLSRAALGARDVSGAAELRSCEDGMDSALPVPRMAAGF